MPEDPPAARRRPVAPPIAPPVAPPVAPWYLAYLILGLINSGLLPFLLPLDVAGRSHDLGQVAVVIGAYNAGMLPSPLLGALAERRQLFRAVFFGGFIALAVGLVALPEATRLAWYAPLALMMGFGVGAAATVAPLFVIDFVPRPEWEPRIGWLQSFNGAGQLAGLLLAGAVAGGRLAYGFWLAGGLAGLALVLGRIGLPRAAARPGVRLPRLAWAELMRGFSGPGLGGLLQHSHHLRRAALVRLPRHLRGRFGRFLLAWGLWSFGTAPFFAYYPLLMAATYGVAPAATALVYALAAGIGIGLFVLAGRVAEARGALLVFRAALSVRMAGFAVLAILAAPGLAGAVPGAAPLALLGFALIMLAWPALSVAGTGLAAELAPSGKGSAMGLLAASAAVATVLGTFLGGWLIVAFGYNVMLLVAIAGLAGAEMAIRRGVCHAGARRG